MIAVFVLFRRLRPPPPGHGPPALDTRRSVKGLHEAEDESQEFGDLHAAIRTARKAYQTDGSMPDWEAVAQAAEAVRQIAP